MDIKILGIVFYSVFVDWRVVVAYVSLVIFCVSHFVNQIVCLVLFVVDIMSIVDVLFFVSIRCVNKNSLVHLNNLHNQANISLTFIFSNFPP